MKLNKWEDFLLENVLNESILYFSEPLEKVIKRIDDPISDRLMSMRGTDIEEDMTLIDIDNKEGYVNFSTSKKINKLWNEGNDGEPEEAPFLKSTMFKAIYGLHRNGNEMWKRGRSPIKVGRFVKKLLPDLTDKDIERFSNKFRAALNKPDEQIMVVEGDEIKKWYLHYNYFEIKHTLGGSCMRYERCSDYLNIYSENPDVCKLLCIVKLNSDDEYKLVARALIWKVEDQEFDFFLDRQYTIHDSYVDKMREWAKNMGYAYKTNNNHTDITLVTYEETNKLNMVVKLKNYKFKSYPYMDTFKKLDTQKGTLHNTLVEEGVGYILNKTDGTYKVISEMIYSEWHGEYYPEARLVYSNFLDDYILRGESVEVTRGSGRHRGWYPEGHERIVYDYWNDDFLFDNDAVYSQYYEGHIMMEESCMAIIELDFKDFELEISNESDVHTDDDNFVNKNRVSSSVRRNIEDIDSYDKIKRNLLTFSQVFNFYVPKVVSVKLNIYDISIDETPTLFLTEEDFNLLRILPDSIYSKYEKSGETLTDKFHYNDLLKKLNLHDKLLKLYPEDSERYKELVNLQ